MLQNVATKTTVSCLVVSFFASSMYIVVYERTCMHTLIYKY